MIDVRGKRAVVCGASQGIGRAVAVELANRGAAVILVSRDAERLASVERELDRTWDQEHCVLVADLARPEEAAQALRAHIADRGAVEILVHNTGGPPAGPLSEATGKDLLAAMTQHLVSAQLLTQAVLPGMEGTGYGRIITVTSTSVLLPILGLGVSNTVRAAMANWVRTMAGELGVHGITVNNVLPGFTDTARLQSLVAGRAQREGRRAEAVADEMRARVPLRRFAQPAEVAAVVGFLASPAASYVSGTSIPVDGGRTAAQ